MPDTGCTALVRTRRQGPHNPLMLTCINHSHIKMPSLRRTSMTPGSQQRIKVESYGQGETDQQITPFLFTVHFLIKDGGEKPLEIWIPALPE